MLRITQNSVKYPVPHLNWFQIIIIGRGGGETRRARPCPHLATTQNGILEIMVIKNQSAFWKALAIVFAILWSATILLWLLYKNKNAAKDIENVVNNKRNQAHEIKSATKNVENALITGEAEIIQDALLKWAGSLWSENPPLGIEQIGERIPELKNGIKSLNSLLYGNQDKEDSLEDLQKKFCRLSLTAKKNDENIRYSQLTPMYPESK